MGWGAGLLQVAGAAGEGGFKAAGEVAEKNINTKIEEAKEAALEKRLLNLEKIRQTFQTGERKAGQKFTGEENEASRKHQKTIAEGGWTSAEGIHRADREARVSEGLLERQSRERIAKVKSDEETIGEKKYADETALRNLSVELSAMGLELREDPNGQIMVTIPTDEDGKPKDTKALEVIDQLGLAFKTGKPRMVKDRWGPNNDYGVDVYIGGRVSKKGVLQPETEQPVEGKSDLDELLSLIPNVQGQTTSQPKQSSQQPKGLLSGPTVGRGKINYPPR